LQGICGNGQDPQGAAARRRYDTLDTQSKRRVTIDAIDWDEQLSQRPGTHEVLGHSWRTTTCLLTTVWLLAAGIVHAASPVVEITPVKLEDMGFTFRIEADPLSDGTVNFRIVVTETGASFSSNASTALGFVEITESSRSVRPVRQLTYSRQENSLVSTFLVDTSAVDDGVLCFLFTNYAEKRDGEIAFMPAADFFYARLKDFVRHRAW
jgi:hypothetical protein